MSIHSILSLAGGELDPALHARTDQTKYATGLRTLRNNIIQKHGGTTSRPGSYFIAEVKDSTGEQVLIPYTYPATATTSEAFYILEFGDEYMRVFENGSAWLEATKTVTGISQANPCVFNVTSHGYTTGDEIEVSASSTLPEFNGRRFKITVINANQFSLQDLGGNNFDSSAISALSSVWTANVSKVYEIATPWVEADLPYLQYTQADEKLILVTRNGLVPGTITRTSSTAFTYALISYGPDIDAPSTVTATGTGRNFRVSAVDEVTGEESYATYDEGGSTGAVSITAASVTGALFYRFYMDSGNGYGLIAEQANRVFSTSDIATVTIDYEQAPVILPIGILETPTVTAFVGQRLMFALNQTVYASRLGGGFYNFDFRFDRIGDGDPYKFRMVGRESFEIRHILDLNRLIILTSRGPFVCNGNDAGIVTPTAINAKQFSNFGSNHVRPVILDDSAIYVHLHGQMVRDLADPQSSKGADLTIFSNHLFERKQILYLALQDSPHPIVWAVRDDGKALGLTYVKEHQLWGWHRHDTLGDYKNFCTVDEGNRKAVYQIVERTIDGRQAKYIERMEDVGFDDIVDAIVMDSALTYDGRHTGSTTMTISGGTDWDEEEQLTLTASASTFLATDIGNEIHVTGSDGTVIRLEIEAYTSATVVTVRPQRTIPVAMRSVALTTWGKAVDEVTGLWHLEGEAVSIFADGFVKASPYNPEYETVTVTDGTVTLSRCYQVIHVGLPFIQDIETLDIDSPEGTATADKKLLVNQVTLHLKDTRGVWVGPKPPSDDDTDALEDLTALQFGEDDKGYNQAQDTFTGKKTVNILPEWNSNGRVFIRQVDPVPMGIVAIKPTGHFGR